MKATAVKSRQSALVLVSFRAANGRTIMAGAKIPAIGMSPGGASIPELIENAKKLDDLGLAGFWVGDSGHDAFVSAAAIASHVKKTPIGTAVALLARSPMQTVIACTSIMEIAQAGFTLGLGMGPAYRNVDWHGIPFQRPAARMADYIRAVR